MKVFIVSFTSTEVFSSWRMRRRVDMLLVLSMFIISKGWKHLFQLQRPKAVLLYCRWAIAGHPTVNENFLGFFNNRCRIWVGTVSFRVMLYVICIAVHLTWSISFLQPAATYQFRPIHNDMACSLLSSFGIDLTNLNYSPLFFPWKIWGHNLFIRLVTINKSFNRRAKSVGVLEIKATNQMYTSKLYKHYMSFSQYPSCVRLSIYNVLSMYL